MKNLLLVFVLCLMSCEMHKQENIIQGELEAQNSELSAVDSLTAAIIQNDLDAVKKLLSENGDIDINSPNKEGELILIKAVISNRLVIAYYLIQAGADPTIENEEGDSAESLVQDREDANSWLTIFKGEALEEEVANLEVFKSIKEANAVNEEKYLPLIQIYFLLGANPDARNEGQFSYLMEASGAGLIETVKFLCTLPETDPNVKVVRGRGRRKRTFTALILAQKYPEIQNVLRECGAVE